MAGTFAHLTLVDILCHERLESIANLTPSLRAALQNYTHFCKLGALSPDCPYLVGSTGATGYGNVMHYHRTADFVRFAIPYIYELKFNLSDSRAAIAWIFGYAAHLVTDLTIHPVVSLKVGPYEKNKKGHRLCELHQDTYIYQKYAGEKITEAEFLKSSGLADCSFKGNTNKLNPVVSGLWTYCLGKYPPAEIKKYLRLPKQSLEPNVWYATYIALVDKFVTKGSHLPLASVFQGNGFAYPDYANLDLAYIENLQTPSGRHIHYDELFGTAMENVMKAWGELALAVDNNQMDRFKLPNANLDTGLADADSKPVFVC